MVPTLQCASEQSVDVHATSKEAARRAAIARHLNSLFTAKLAHVIVNPISGRAPVGAFGLVGEYPSWFRPGGLICDLGLW